VRSFPVRTCLSGPAAGVVGAAELGKAARFRNIVTFDVGGTSTDVSLVVDGKPLFTSLRAIAEYPVKTPMVDIHVIGAGGGSIAAIDEGGALKVGPRSAGAEPGPAGYGRGGSAATLTDAHIALHRLNPSSLLDGRLPIDEARACAAIMAHVARPLGLSLEEAAEGIIRIANANMGRAIRAVSTERGYDLGQFALFAYGGAGPLHAIDVALECGIAAVIVPQEPGTLCARGMLLTDVSFDFVRSLIAAATPQSWQTVQALLGAMRVEAGRWLQQERVAAHERSFRCHIDARYEGQNFEVMVPLAQSDTQLDRFLRDFASAHEREYGYSLADRPVEIVNCRLQAVGAVPKAPLADYTAGGALAHALAASRLVYFGRSHGWLDTPVYARSRIAAHECVAGPAVIEEMSSTVVLAPGSQAAVDTQGNVVVHLRERES
jgi:N-methylhydantoinase A